MAKVVHVRRRRAVLLLSLGLVAYFLAKALLKGGLKFGVQAGGPWWESFAALAVFAVLVGLVALWPITRAMNTRRFHHIGMRRVGWSRYEGTVGGRLVRAGWPDKHWLFGSLDETKWLWSAPVGTGRTGWAIPPSGRSGEWRISPGAAWEDFFRQNETFLRTAPPEVSGLHVRSGRVEVETDRMLLRQDLGRVAHWTGDLARRLEAR